MIYFSQGTITVRDNCENDVTVENCIKNLINFMRPKCFSGSAFIRNVQSRTVLRQGCIRTETVKELYD